VLPLPNRSSSSIETLPWAIAVGMPITEHTPAQIPAGVIHAPGLLVGLGDVERQRMMALTQQGDQIFYPEVLNGYWDASRIRNVQVPREGHRYHVRSADGFNKHIAAFAP
jgi:hypothetical protein